MYLTEAFAFADVQPRSGGHAQARRCRHLRGDDGDPRAREAGEEAEPEAWRVPLQAAAAASGGRAAAKARERAYGSVKQARAPAGGAMPGPRERQQPRPAAAGEEAANRWVAERGAKPHGGRAAARVGAKGADAAVRCLEPLPADSAHVTRTVRLPGGSGFICNYHSSFKVLYMYSYKFRRRR